MQNNFNIFELKKILKKYNSFTTSFDFVNISLASPCKIQSWCQNRLPNGEILGEILNSETLNFKTKIPISDGLFCQKIFGPINDWTCKCGKYKGVFFNKICEICKVQLTESRVRRYKMGYISLPSPVCHYWYFSNNPAYLYILLKLAEPKLNNQFFKKLIYFHGANKYFNNISNDNFNFSFLNKKDKYFQFQGSENILQILEDIGNNIEEKIEYLRSKNIKYKQNLKALRLLESFFATSTKPEWLILTYLPILPPSLRPLVEVQNEEFVSSDINEFYRIIFYRIQRYQASLQQYNIKKSLFLIDPTIKTIIYHDKKLIQEGIDALIDNGKLPKDISLSLNNRPLKSLTEILKGKYGRFRLTLLGKRVDYSARSVIVVEPDLQLNEFGLPYNIAIKIFKPFLINLLNKTKIKNFIKNDKLLELLLEENRIYIWKLLEKLAENYSFLLNRAPTLHRFGIQSFLPIITSLKAIQLHPLVCSGFNADFDGDQMALHLPLCNITQLETKSIMRPSFNIFSPSNGELILKPAQDVIIGCYYLSIFPKFRNYFNNFWFINEFDVLNSLYKKKINIHTSIFIRYDIKNFKLKIKKNNLYISSSKTNKNDIKIINIFKNLKKEIYLFTNIGIFIGKQFNIDTYLLTTLFLQTTPGRVILNDIFKNI